MKEGLEGLRGKHCTRGCGGHVGLTQFSEETLTSFYGKVYISSYGELSEMREGIMLEVVTIAKALSDDNRVQIVAIDSEVLCLTQQARA